MYAVVVIVVAVTLSSTVAARVVIKRWGPVGTSPEAQGIGGGGCGSAAVVAQIEDLLETVLSCVGAAYERNEGSLLIG